MTGERMLAGRYRLVRRLGQGAMGVVWQARDEALGRDVAVKELLLPAGVPADRRATAAQRAMREARAAALVKHPSIVTVHDVVQDDGRPCIVMDLLPGRSLDAVLSGDGPLPPERVAEIGLDVLAALRTAHERGILHRDVKPANIFLRDDGRAVLTDFGIASLAGDTTLTETGALIGSPAYMAPERVRHERGGPESDLWSLGVTLYVLVEGRTPFSRTTVMGTLGAVLTEPVEPPREAGPLAPVVLALLAKDPAVRLNAQGAEQWLGAVAAGKPVPRTRPVQLPPGPPAAGPLERPTEPGGPGGRRRAPLAAAAIAVIAVVTVALAIVFWPDGNGSEPRTSPSGSSTGSPRSAAPSAAAPAKLPSVCTLLTPAQAGQLVPGFTVAPQAATDASTKRPSRGCIWSTSVAGGSTGEDRLAVTAEGEAPGAAAGSTRARFAEKRDLYAPRGGTPDPGRPFNDIKDPGDQAFVVVEPATKPKATVYFRTGSLLVDVRFESDRGRTPAQVHDQAIKAARWLAAAIQRSS
ncbi:serine/threonine-protein kinase [Spirillospora sp. NPDC048911]|uniref:serine/threonine-protein kinase n=1 Tax=Spirillospora sp. NPDC048911 TaxID=3364527 RepID=UPI00371BE195